MKRLAVLSVVVFAVMAMGHLARVILGWEVAIAGRTIPTWVSGVAFLALALLAVLLWLEATGAAAIRPATAIRPAMDERTDPDPEKYGAAISLIEQQFQIFWLVFGAFLLAETVLLGGVVSIAKDGPTELILGGATVGLLLVVPWWTSFRYNHAMYTLRIMQARAFEPGSGSFFEEGRRLIEDGQPVRGIRMPWSARVLPPRWADAALIFLFGAAFLFLAVWTWFWRYIPSG
jgi:putative Ca2+/H+ antiporter (TMEM165/GDT1 family)